MKKQYVIPEMDIIAIHYSQMLAVSDRSIFNQNATTNTTGDYDDARGFAGFDDDDE